MIEAVSDVTSRIAMIQGQIRSFQAPLVSTVTTSPSTLSDSQFAQALQEAVEVTTPAQPPSGDVDAKGVPVALRTYGNGHVPADALSAVNGTNELMWAPAARSLEQMLAAAKRDGHAISINDSYRSYDEQVEMVAEKGLYGKGGLAAEPGTSMHGWGVAVDLKLDAGAQEWMRTHAGEFGYVANVKGEPWHWQFLPR